MWMKPLPAPRADSDSPSWAFPFSYITPQAAHLQPVMRLMFPESAGDLSKVPNSGPAPVLMREQEWRKVGSLPAVQIVFETHHLPLTIPFSYWSQIEQSSKLNLFSLQKLGKLIEFYVKGLILLGQPMRAHTGLPTKQVVPDWERLTAHIESHKQTKDTLGWVSRT